MGGKAQLQDDIPSSSSKALRRVRNKCAARKCRQKRKEYITRLQEQLNMGEAQRRSLRSRLQELTQVYAELKAQQAAVANLLIARGYGSEVLALYRSISAQQLPFAAHNNIMQQLQNGVHGMGPLGHPGAPPVFARPNPATAHQTSNPGSNQSTSTLTLLEASLTDVKHQCSALQGETPASPSSTPTDATTNSSDTTTNDDSPSGVEIDDVEDPVWGQMDDLLADDVAFSEFNELAFGMCGFDEL